MSLWNPHKEFSSNFLARHHDLILYDVFHHIKAFLLYPPHCACAGSCTCQQSRDNIVLTLSVNLHNQAEERQESPHILHAMRLLLKIPEDSFFKKHHGKAYPLWLIQENLYKKDTKKNFKIVERLVWGLLRLAQTYYISIFGEWRASITEAINMILGSAPLKTKGKETHLCGEKAYGTQLNTYKSVCHLIAAFNFMEANDPPFSAPTPQQITEFLSLSQWFKEKLLLLQTPNIKGKSLFSEDILLPLPPWVTSDTIDIPIHPFDHKLQEIKAQFEQAIRHAATLP